MIPDQKLSVQSLALGVGRQQGRQHLGADWRDNSRLVVVNAGLAFDHVLWRRSRSVGRNTVPSTSLSAGRRRDPEDEGCLTVSIFLLFWFNVP